MPVVNTRKPVVTLVAYDAYGNELTATIEIEVESDARAIELWQKIRKYMEKL